MQPNYWRPPFDLSEREQGVINRIRRAKIFVFLRLYRHRVFDETFQHELICLYHESHRGQPPVPPALLAMATLLQAYTRASDNEVIEASTMDLRWQMALNCIGTEDAPFSKGTLVAFRRRLIEARMEQCLIEQVIDIARETGAFGTAALRAALDSSPLWKTYYVEDSHLCRIDA